MEHALDWMMENWTQAPFPNVLADKLHPSFEQRFLVKRCGLSVSVYGKWNACTVQHFFIHPTGNFWEEQNCLFSAQF